MLIGKELASAPDAALHLIVDQQQLAGLAQLAQALEVAWTEDVDPPPPGSARSSRHRSWA